MEISMGSDTTVSGGAPLEYDRGTFSRDNLYVPDEMTCPGVLGVARSHES